MKEIFKLKRNGMVAVIISNDSCIRYSSSMSNELGNSAMFNSSIAEYVLGNEQQMAQQLACFLYDLKVVGELEVVWVKENKEFYINNFKDGYEEVIVLDQIKDKFNVLKA